MTVNPASYDALIAATARTTEDVTLSTGGTIPIRGLTLIEFLNVLRRFPSVRDLLLSTIGGGDADGDLDRGMAMIQSMIDSGPEVVAHVIATAMGAPGDQKAIDLLLALSDEDFLALTERTVTLTMPDGVAGFFARFAALAGRLGLGLGLGQARLSAEAA